LPRGTNRVDEGKIAALIGEPIARADAEFVREAIGFSIGGVFPAGLLKPLKTLIDQDLTTFAAIWTAAGTPNAVFRLTPADLVRLTGGTVADAARRG